MTSGSAPGKPRAENKHAAPGKGATTWDDMGRERRKRGTENLRDDHVITPATPTRLADGFGEQVPPCPETDVHPKYLGPPLSAIGRNLAIYDAAIILFFGGAVQWVKEAGWVEHVAKPAS